MGDDKKKKKRPMKLISLYMPEPYIEGLDRLVDAKYYPSRAGAIRAAIRDLLKSKYHPSKYQRETGPMKLKTLCIPEPYLDDLDKLVREGAYPTRSDAIRYAISYMLSSELQLVRNYESTQIR